MGLFYEIFKTQCLANTSKCRIWRNIQLCQSIVERTQCSRQRAVFLWHLEMLKKAMEITGKSYDMSQWNGLEDNEVDFNQLERIVAKKKEQQQNSNNKKKSQRRG